MPCMHYMPLEISNVRNIRMQRGALHAGCSNQDIAVYHFALGLAVADHEHPLARVFVPHGAIDRGGVRDTTVQFNFFVTSLMSVRIAAASGSTRPRECSHASGPTELQSLSTPLTCLLFEYLEHNDSLESFLQNDLVCEGGTGNASANADHLQLLWAAQRSGIERALHMARALHP